MLRRGACIEPGCGESFYRVSANQKFCEKHAVIGKAMATKGPRSISCAVCRKQFSSHIANKAYCSEKCRDVASRDRKLASKGMQKPLGSKRLRCCDCDKLFYCDYASQTRCAKCNGRLAQPTRPTATKDDLPCLKCVHSAPNKYATFGVECTIGWWLRCKPLNLGAKPKEVRREALDPTAETA